MTARGLLFTPENYTKSESGVKTQTRRIITADIPEDADEVFYYRQREERSAKIAPSGVWARKHGDDGYIRFVAKCPYGQPGDRLYCKESHYRWGRWRRNGFTKKGRPRWRFRCHKTAPVKFTLNATEKRRQIRITDKEKWGWQKRSPLFMPKKAARLWLELTGVRVEQLGSISEADAIAEGVESVSKYIDLWLSISGTWNPKQWVLVLEYRRIQP